LNSSTRGILLREAFAEEGIEKITTLESQGVVSNSGENFEEIGAEFEASGLLGLTSAASHPRAASHICCKSSTASQVSLQQAHSSAAASHPRQSQDHSSNLPPIPSCISHLVFPFILWFLTLSQVYILDYFVIRTCNEI